MCLSVVWAKDVGVLSKPLIGYKVLIEEDGELSAWLYSQLGQKYLPRYSWIMADCPKIEHSSYNRGFHIFSSLEEAKELLEWSNDECCQRHFIYKVEYNDILAVGLDDNKLCVVARMMKILEKVM